MDALRDRDNVLAETLRREQSAAIAVLAAATQPLVDEVSQMANEAAQALARAFAAARAVELATSHGEAGRLAERLRKVADTLIVEHLHPIGPVPVPDEIVSALHEAESSISALRHTVPSEVRVF